MILRLLAFALMGAALAGCASPTATSVSGACGAFRPAPHTIKTETQTGQIWVNGTIEAQHRVCGFPRPSARR